jgi:hypothetical protein
VGGLVLVEEAMSKFGKLVGKLKRKEPDLSDESARKIAAAAGRAKYGAEGMAKKAAAAKKKG